MRNYSLKLKMYSKLVYCVLLIFLSDRALAQTHVTLNKSVKDCLTEIFAKYNDVKRMQIVVRNDLAEAVYVDGPIDDDVLKGSKNNTYFSLKYLGDLFFLKKQYPLIEKLTKNKELMNSIDRQDRNFILTLEAQSISIKPPFDGSVFCGLRYSSQLEFQKKLNANYKETIVPFGDSILILQAIVNRDGSLGKKMLLHGDEDDKLYSYICDNYQDYNQENKANLTRKGLFLPYRSGGIPFTSIIEIFVRLNSDRTFSVSGSGRERKLRIKDYKEDPNDPLMLF
ncbi:hypothetical protein [uncultured Sphingobacterium sp.]|uniref:hypothetical protein n=1 Tax=uncultured Sphingobacterium sp. TaxID=182688 RepID=UPI0025E997B4|nr:hypothetical protein [uncultured Sphingobacterium sp.]